MQAIYTPFAAIQSSLTGFVNPVTFIKDGVSCQRYLEEFVKKRIGGCADITPEDLRVLSFQELQDLAGVLRDLENYNLEMAMIERQPKDWDPKYWKAWIHFVSHKYVDNHEVDVSKGEDTNFQNILRQYWEKHEDMWKDASIYYNRVREHYNDRIKYEEMQSIANLFEIKSINPDSWDAEDLDKFKRYIRIKYPSDNDIDGRCLFDLELWKKTFMRMNPPPRSFVPYSTLPVQQNIISSSKPTDISDPEDWDRSALNQWLDTVSRRYGFDAGHIPERHRRLLMIYVRCAWPHDEQKIALTCLNKVFDCYVPNGDRISCQLYQDIVNMRSPPRQHELCTKAESQRHRNRRDLHLWEFLLILLANPEFEKHSIHWKKEEDGKFELSDRHQVARMWGLTKGNTNMTYDNMSRSVRQYYKDEGGIMIRHRTGQPSFGKYSYQFSMNNTEVEKLWKSLESR